MTVSIFGADFRAAHAVRVIKKFNHVFMIDGFGEAGPTATGIELGAGCKKRLSGNDININTWSLKVKVLSRTRLFGAAFLSDAVLLRAKFRNRFCRFMVLRH